MMIDEEKQPEKTSYQTDDDSAVVEETSAVTSLPEQADLSGDLELEQQLSQPDARSEISHDAVAEEQSAESAEELIAAAAVADSNKVLIESLKEEIATLKAQLEASNNQGESCKTQYMRMSADFDNFRKRTNKEKEELETQVKCKTITELLPVVDNFERARSHLNPQADSGQTIHKSYQSVYKQLVDCLKRVGVSPMRPEGKEFDPNLHEAVMREQTEEYPEGTVMEELVRGYFLGDRILRHAMVKVAAAPEPVITSEEGHPDTAEN